MYINNLGNVGIGVMSPAAKLDVNLGTTYSSQNIASLRGPDYINPQIDLLNFGISNNSEFTVETNYSVTGGSVDFAPHNMTNDSVPSPYVVSESSSYVSVSGFYAFDNSAANFAWIGNGTSGFVELDLGAGHSYILDNYSVVGAPVGYTSRTPKNWTVEGSNDGSSWTVVSTIINQTGWGSNETRNFVSDVRTTAYRYFKFNITANNGDGGYTQVDELYFYRAAAGAAPNLVLGAGGKHLTIVNSGNVGIGTTTPGQLLSVAGNMQLAGALFDKNNASGTLGMILQTTGTGTQWVATSTLGIGAS